MLAPSPHLQFLIRAELPPKLAILRQILSEITAIPADDPALTRCLVSVIAPCSLLLIGARGAPGPLHDLRQMPADELAAHLHGFALAGLEATGRAHGRSVAPGRADAGPLQAPALGPTRLLHGDRRPPGHTPATMPYRWLIQPAELRALLQDAPGSSVVFDCSFDLGDTAAGARAYAAGHLAGALYLHLDDDLSGTKTGRNGRHPLPPPDGLAERLAAAGVGDDTQVVAYDRSSGVYASRLWWLLRWLGHERVAVLDGGLAAWREAGGGVEPALPAPRPRGRFTRRPSLVATAERADLLANLTDRRRLVVDARGAERFRGENEPIDPVAGHIPGACNRPFGANVDAAGRFKPSAQLAAEWAPFVEGRHAADLVMMCGSGVTACHHVLALELAGIGGAAVYPGSWSEWIADPQAPIATGPA